MKHNSCTARTGFATRALLKPLLPLAFASAALIQTTGAQVAHRLPRTRPEIWIGHEELAALPTSGVAWEALSKAAALPLSPPNIGGRDDNADVMIMAKALVAERTDDDALREQVLSGIILGMGTENCGDVLSLGRNIAGYVIAADLVGLPPEVDRVFQSWLASLLDRNLGGETLRRVHERRPNNIGMHSGGARVVIAAYLENRRELARVAQVLKGWLGDRSSYAGFEYGSMSWQLDPDEPVGVVPAHAMREGHSIDGVLADDQRRSGDFAWPPPRENYVYEALQGALLQAVVLSRLGYDVWEWEDRALLRAHKWLVNQAIFPAAGDDTWQPYVINKVYGAKLPVVMPAHTGKNVGWTDWTHPYEPNPPKVHR